MSMNEADILYDCIVSEIDDAHILDWVDKLCLLADPNAERIRELEKQLDVANNTIADFNFAKDTLAEDNLGFMNDIDKLEKQLAKSVPKSEIWKILSPKESTGFPNSRKTIVRNITKLL